MKINKDDIVVVFDGYCVMCSKFVSWLAKRDTQNKIFYTTFESNFLNINYPDIKLEDTVFVIDHNAKTYIKTQAIKVCLEKIKHKSVFLTGSIIDFVQNFKSYQKRIHKSFAQRFAR